MTAKKDSRLARIVSIIAERKQADVAELSGLLQVSQVTIRKDLDELEKKGLIRREHGFAHINNTDDIAGRLAYHYDEKMKIAVKAASLVSDGDTLMIESGSCCALLARVLADTKKNLTIVTNSAFIASYIRDAASASLILLGGIYQNDSQCLVGPMIRDGAANYYVKHYFIGTDGWSLRTGFTNNDQMRAQAVRDMAASARDVVILTESEKFSAAGSVPLNVKDQPKTVITDGNIPEEAETALKNMGIRIEIAS
ncbi:MAG: DeoR/GlpR family DNA-binding transcription regulator [Solobacterium sp.]|nr:DeoR/GlpR family DNA-binding transcription regulator [Solobacterium sp.]